jgi:hypothetical protein
VSTLPSSGAKESSPPTAATALVHANKVVVSKAARGSKGEPYLNGTRIAHERAREIARRVGHCHAVRIGGRELGLQLFVLQQSLVVVEGLSVSK